MTLSRRTFLFSFGAAGFTLASGGATASGKPLLKFGVLSDSHVTEDPATAEPLKRIFGWFSREGVDAVCHAGDICHLGNFNELKLVTDAWSAAFPGGKNVSGGKVQPVFCFGNHDYHSASFQRGTKVTEEDKKFNILYDKDRAWKMLTGEEKFPGEVASYEVKGHTFLIAHWSHENEIEEWFKAHPQGNGRPLFHVRHPHPANTCFGEWASSVMKGRETLMRHPEAFVMSGHSHLNVGNDCGIWQGGFVSMGCGSARMPGTGSFGGEYDNSPAKTVKDKIWHTYVPSSRAWQGSVVTVYESSLVVERRDFLYEEAGEAIGEAWDLKVPFQHNAAHPFAIAEAALPPQFGGKERISVEHKKGKRNPDKQPEAQLWFKVSAPAKSDGPHSRPGFYRFELTEAETKRALATRTVVHNGWCGTEKRGKPVICCFAEEELPKGVSVIVTVTPMNAAKREGRAIKSAALLI